MAGSSVWSKSSQNRRRLHFGKAMHRALERLLAEHAHTLEPAALSLERAEGLWQQAWAESGVVGIGPFCDQLQRGVRKEQHAQGECGARCKVSHGCWSAALDGFRLVFVCLRGTLCAVVAILGLGACSRRQVVSADPSASSASLSSTPAVSGEAPNTTAPASPSTYSAPTTAVRAVGPVVVLASGQHGPGDIAIDATSVYWANYHGDTVMKVPLHGGAPVVLASAQTKPHGVVVDGSFVYWATVDSILKVPAGGGAATVIVREELPGGLAVDAMNLYWVTMDQVRSVPLAGGAPVTLSSARSAVSIVLHGHDLYWKDSDTKRIMKMPASGGSAVQLSSDGKTLGGLAVDGTSAYWADPYGGTLTKVPVGGGPSTTLASGFMSTGAVATDGSNLYFTADGAVRKMSVAGGAPVVVASGRTPHSVAVDATNVYWTDAGTDGKHFVDGSVMRAAK